MKTFTYVFFYGYIVTLILAGAWGVFFATLDHWLLFRINVHLLARVPAASLVSQYRFLRAIECGFGMFSIIYHREIFTVRAFNRLFLGTMAFGVAARFVSFILDGWPFPVFYFFLAWELIGIVFIYAYSRGTLERG